MENTSLSTWAALRSLGFDPDGRVYSDPPGGLSLDFGNFRLQASYVISLAGPVVMMSGVLRTPGTLAEVAFDMPRDIESRVQCAAWIVWHLDRAADGRFVPARNGVWLEDGRRNVCCLPWVKHMALYEARPHCSVPRDWLRLALRDLRDVLSITPDRDSIIFAFDGSILSIRVGEKVIACAANGSAWPAQYMLPADRLRSLPKRLLSYAPEIGIWEERLTIDRYSYAGVLVIGESGSASRTASPTMP